MVASAASFADGLTAGAYAGALRAPLLLTDPDQLSPALENLVQHSDLRDVVLCGGTDAISDAVMERLRVLLNND